MLSGKGSLFCFAKWQVSQGLQEFVQSMEEYNLFIFTSLS